MIQKGPYDPSDPKQVKEAKKERRYLEERFATGISKIVNDRDCRFVLSQFLEHAGLLSDNFDKDPFVHARASGLRNAGLWWFTNGCLHVKDFMDKLRSDDGSNLKSGSHDDGLDTDTYTSPD